MRPALSRHQTGGRHRGRVLSGLRRNKRPNTPDQPTEPTACDRAVLRGGGCVPSITGQGRAGLPLSVLAGQAGTGHRQSRPPSQAARGPPHRVPGRTGPKWTTQALVPFPAGVWGGSRDLGPRLRRHGDRRALGRERGLPPPTCTLPLRERLRGPEGDKRRTPEDPEGLTGQRTVTGGEEEGGSALPPGGQRVEEKSRAAASPTRQATRARSLGGC